MARRCRSTASGSAPPLAASASRRATRSGRASRSPSRPASTRARKSCGSSERETASAKERAAATEANRAATALRAPAARFSPSWNSVATTPIASRGAATRRIASAASSGPGSPSRIARRTKSRTVSRAFPMPALRSGTHRRAERVVDEGDRYDAEHDRGDAGNARFEHRLRRVDVVDGDDRHRVARQHGAVGLGALEVVGDEDATSHPGREGDQQLDPVLSEESREQDRHREADHRAEEAVGGLRQGLPAPGLGQDRHRDGGRGGAFELEPEPGIERQHHGEPDPQGIGPGGDGRRLDPVEDGVDPAAAPHRLSHAAPGDRSRPIGMHDSNSMVG